jgi:uncharacterized protein (TIGR02284 family)
MKKRKINLLKKYVLWVAPLAFFGCHPSHVYAGNVASVQAQKTTEETAKILQELAQYEIDGFFLVNQCIDNVKNQAIKDKLSTIKGECEGHINDLSVLIKKYGKEAPEYTKDFKGYFMEGYAAMRGAFTDQGALKALHTNLKLILKSFEKNLSLSFPADVKETVMRIYENKKKSIQYLESQI